jgi:hypothetical protein
VISDGMLTFPLYMTLPNVPAAEAAALLTAHGLSAGGTPTPSNVSLIALRQRARSDRGRRAFCTPR